MPKSKSEEDLPEGKDTFDRAYVEELRAEAAKYRTSLRPYEAAFGDFNQHEKEFLFGMLKALNQDPKEGAKQFRDMAKNVLQDDFYADLEDIPQPEPQEEAGSDEEQEGEDQVSLTPEQLKAELDAREEAQRKAAEEAAMQAEIEAVYKEIEDAGFERGTPEFQTALSLGASLTQSGQDVDFKALAPKVRIVHDLPEPEAPETAPETAEPSTEAEPSPAPQHPVTAGAGGSGNGAEPAKDWVAEAKAEGKDVMQVARERMEARLAD